MSGQNAGDTAIKAGDLVVVVHTECCASVYRNMVLRVDSIYRRGVLSCACDKFRTKEPLAIFEREHPYALPLSWLKRINPPAVREAVERGEEIVA